MEDRDTRRAGRRSGVRRVVLRTGIGVALALPLAALLVGSALAATITSLAWYGGITNGNARATGLAATYGTADQQPYCVGTNFVISGSGFVTDGVTGVTIGGVAARYFSVGDNATLYAGIGADAKTGPVVVTTRSGGTATSTSNVTITPCQAAAPVAKPAATAVSPAKAKGGKKVELLGSGFIGTRSVTVGGVATSFSVPSDYNLYVIVPKTAKNGALPIVVTTAAGPTTLKVKVTKTA
jgi:hypothetical protein